MWSNTQAPMIHHNHNRSDFIDYYLQLNQTINLTAVRQQDDFFLKHIVDSLTLYDHLDLQPGQTLCDVGTGGWFPLLPLAIAYPKIQCTWLDSTKKKLDAIQQIAIHFQINNVDTIRSRVEHHRHTYDIVTCRAVAYSDILIPQIIHLTHHKTSIVLYKSYSKEEEHAISTLCHRFHLTVYCKHHYQLFENDCHRVLYILRKAKR